MTSLTSIGDRLNPILVKEVRQAVRGKFFRIGFLIILAIAGVVAALSLTEIDSSGKSMQEQGGAFFFVALHSVFAVAAMLLVPLHATRSMSAEKDDHTYDALVTSGLRPAQIIQGKWLAAGMLLLLFLSAFAPFLVVGFTLFGLDILTSLLTVVFTLVFSMSLNLLGLFAACIAKNRAVQTMLLALVSMICLGTLIWWCAATSIFALEPMGAIPIRGLLVTALAVFVGVNLVNLWGYGLTVSVITHAEENGMFRVRWACIFVSIFCVIVNISVWAEFHELDSISFMLIASYAVVTFMNIPLLTESNHLGVRCRHQISHGQWRRSFSWMFLPGGSSALPLYLMQMAIVSIPLLIPNNPLLGSFGATTDSFAGHGVFAALSFLAIVLPAILIPAKFAARPETKAFGRNSLRLLVLFILPLTAIFVSLVGAFIGKDGFESGFNPFYVVGKNFNRLREEEALVAWSFLAFISVAMQFAPTVAYRQQVRKLRRPPPPLPQVEELAKD